MKFFLGSFFHFETINLVYTKITGKSILRILIFYYSCSGGREDFISVKIMITNSYVFLRGYLMKTGETNSDL